jgi:hypothetical protein
MFQMRDAAILDWVRPWALNPERAPAEPLASVSATPTRE